MKKGFTLLEILIAAIILTVGIISITKAFNTGFFAYSDVEYVEKALNIAQSKMEEIKNTSFASLADSGPTVDPNFSDFSVSVNVAEGNDPCEVNVTVSWNVVGGETSLGLTTLRSNY